MNEHLQILLEGVVQSAREWSDAKAVLETLSANDHLDRLVPKTRKTG